MTKTNRAKQEKTHVEVVCQEPIIWPRVAWEFLENQIKTQIKANLIGNPEERLWFLVEQAIDKMLVGIREVSPGKEVIVHHQTVPIEVYVVESRKGKPIRRRRLSSVEPLEIDWPYST